MQLHFICNWKQIQISVLYFVHALIQLAFLETNNRPKLNWNHTAALKFMWTCVAVSLRLCSSWNVILSPRAACKYTLPERNWLFYTNTLLLKRRETQQKVIRKNILCSLIPFRSLHLNTTFCFHVIKLSFSMLQIISYIFICFIEATFSLRPCEFQESRNWRVKIPCIITERAFLKHWV
jgi:hypothetical protein